MDMVTTHPPIRFFLDFRNIALHLWEFKGVSSEIQEKTYGRVNAYYI